AGVGSYGVPRGGRGNHSLLHHLLDPGVAEGHRVLSLRRQSDAVLGLRRGVHARSPAGNLGPIGPGSEGGRWRVCRTDPSDRDRRRGRVTALYYYRSRIVTWFQGRG